MGTIIYELSIFKTNNIMDKESKNQPTYPNLEVHYEPMYVG